MNTHTSLLMEIVHRQLSYLGHVIGKDDLEGLVVTGFVDGKRPKETFLAYLSRHCMWYRWGRRKKFGRNGVHTAIYFFGL